MINKVSEISDVESDVFESNRKRGENHQYICQLIQKDSIDDFIIFVTRNNISLSSTIHNSIYETNRYLLNNEKVDLISYSAFYGSIQIFNFLYLNKVDTSHFLWFYTIHGRNPEIIHLLENYHIQPYMNSYKYCFVGSLLCHHNEIARYFEENKINDKITLSKSVRYFNFEYFTKDIIDDLYSFYYACKYDNPFIVRYMLEHSTNIDINSIIDDISIKQTCLNAAISERNREIVKMLLSQPNIDVNFRSDFFILCNSNVIDYDYDYDEIENKVEVEVEFEVEVDDVDDENRSYFILRKSPLIEAVIQGDIEIVGLLLSKSEIDVNFPLEYHDNGDYGAYNIEKTALNIAIEKGFPEIVELLLKHPDINVNKICRHNDGSYGFPSGHDRYIDKIALILAVEKGNSQIVTLLLNHPKIDVNIVSRYHDYIYYEYEGYKGNKYHERTALQTAVMLNNIEIINLLLGHSNLNGNLRLTVYNYNHNGINENSYKTDFYAYENILGSDMNDSPLNDPVKMNEKRIKLNDNSFYSSSVINFDILPGSEAEREEKTSLLFAVENKKTDVVQCLLNSHKIDVNCKSLVVSDEGSLEAISSLHRALQMDCPEIVQLLKEHNGIDILDKNPDFD